VKPDVILTLPAHPVPYAVLGSPVGHSLSPAMQQAAFDREKIDARYYRIEADEAGLARAVERMREVPFGGWNCTVPNKVRMFELCDRRAETAENLRAVNTVVNENGVLTGHNTDGTGWSRALREAFGCGAADARILLLGAGGAGRGIATQALLERCPQLLIANRNISRADDLLGQLQGQFPNAAPENLRVVPWGETALEAALRESDLVVNATAAGLDPKEPAVLPARLLRPELLVFDTVYGAGAEKLRLEAEAAGARWCDGLGMLLHQGAEAFSIWTKRAAPLEEMRAALQAAFSASRR
jgi:shikimate dehydrogenase